MKKNILSIEIEKPVEAVFQFTVNPENTPKWIPSILEEKTSGPEVKAGTIYSQKVKTAEGIEDSAIVVTGFVKNKQLDFHLVNGVYTCSYRYESIPSGTRLTYSEENGVDGELDGPMAIENLQTLKKLIEQEA